MVHKYTFPAVYQHKIESLLNEYGHSLDRPKSIAAAVLKLSDHYQEKQRITPWGNSDFVAAYAAYFFPLNYVRSLKLWTEAKRVGFPKNFSRVLDFGCGLGSAVLAGRDLSAWNEPTALHGVDHMAEPVRLLQKYFAADVQPALPSSFSKTLGIFSYSWNELPEEPPWFMKLDHIFIAEPSTSLHARRLMTLRQRLIDNGYFIWAPCTHHEACPLLTQSKSDWCHDRVHWEQPEWFQKIEHNLPIKNNTLTTSYIFASKESPNSDFFGRIVGDELKEKGKTRWLFCRGKDREFLSHLARYGAPPDWKRGDLLPAVIPHELKGQELRLDPTHVD